MIRTSIAAAVLTLAAVAPSFAGGYETRTVVPTRYDDSTSRVVVDGYAGRVAYDEASADHCHTRRHVIGWTSYSRRTVRPTNYGGYGGSGYNGGSGY